MTQKGILLINLGTPEAPTATAVKTYLDEFLMDKNVIPLPFPLRWFLVKKLITPKRSPESAHAYQLVWDKEKGSPLLWISQNLTDEIQKLEPHTRVLLGMRYGNPSIKKAIQTFKKEGIKDIHVVPLYPQYAKATTYSSIENARSILKDEGFDLNRIQWVEWYFDDQRWIQNICASIEPLWNKNQPDYLLCSYHGLPMKAVLPFKKGISQCWHNQRCCSHKDEPWCYRSQCIQSTLAIQKRLNLDSGKIGSSFQSRLGKSRWVQPYTTDVFESLSKKGIKKLMIVCPAFAVDCLETLEEIETQGKEQWMKLGGTEFHMVPALNSNKEWAEALLQILRDQNKLTSTPHFFN
ncbi:MAG: ferrochelatase [Bdellovibrionaceae bacterium]|nr:ferrochelatase [Pseudobdellovibrionaceae bacterium]|tara:strand:+ start:2622 stop:3671 length:1050 start_codon:yes stop_codon:yes gene_type:complete